MSWCFLVFELLFVGGIYVRAAPVMVIWCCCPAAWELLLAFSWFPMLSTCCPTKEKGPTRLAFNKNLHHLMLNFQQNTMQ